MRSPRKGITLFLEESIRARLAGAFVQMWGDLTPIGLREDRSGYDRLPWTQADAELRSWFQAQAASRGMHYEVDRNGNQWAWAGQPGDQALVMGSHLDSVPGGGAYDGALGVASAFLVVDALEALGLSERRPIAVVAFLEEEGGRFGVGCLGSQLLVGAIDPEDVLARTDANGVTMRAAAEAAGFDTSRMGRDEVAIARIGQYLELHVEQGIALENLDAAVGIATQVLAHSRTRMVFNGEANHAGTTPLEIRKDPMIPYAHTVLRARSSAEAHGAVATVGRVEVEHNATNAIPREVRAWLDARAGNPETVEQMVADVTDTASAYAVEHGVRLVVETDSIAQEVNFDIELRGTLERALRAAGIEAPLLPTGAGHDAAVLAEICPTGMLFARNVTGVSHSIEEFSEERDCLAAVYAMSEAAATLVSSD